MLKQFKNQAVRILFSSLAFICFYLFSVVEIRSQSTNYDCPNATPICSDVYSFFDSPVGTGTMAEGQVAGGCLLGGETNSSWFVFTAQQTGQIGFGIITGTGNEDYDWAIWDISASGCDQVNTDIPVSCNYSGQNSLTGPTGATSQISGDASSNPQNDYVNVISGNTYAILIDNWAGTSTGFTVDFANYSPTSIVDVIRPVVTRAKITSCGSNLVRIKFSENVDCSTVDNEDFVITGPGGPYMVTNIQSTQCGNPIGSGNFEQDFSFLLTLDQTPTTPGTYTIKVIEDSIQDLCGNTNPIDSSVFKIVDADFGTLPDTLCHNSTINLSSIDPLASPCIYVKMYASGDNSNNFVRLMENGNANWGLHSFASGSEQTVYFDNITTTSPHVLEFFTTAATAAARINYFVYNCANDQLMTSGNFSGGAHSVNIFTTGFGSSATYTASCSAAITDGGNGTATFDGTLVSGTLPRTCNITYSFNDGNGCVSSQTKSVVVAKLFDAAFNYPRNTYCISDTNPVPINVVDTIGLFSCQDTNLIIDPVTGEIDLDSTEIGVYYIRHNVGIGVCEEVDSVQVSIYGRAEAPEIFGSNSVCPDIDSVLYWTDEMSSYTWSVVGGTVANNGNMDSLLVNWGSADSNAIVKLYGINLNGCKTDTGYFSVIINELLATETPSGMDSLCYFSSQEVTYQITNTNGSTYFWELDFGTLDSGDSTNSIQVSWDTVGTGFIYIREQSTTSTSTCYGESDTLFVQILPSPDTTLMLIDSTVICAFTDSVFFELQGYENSFYNWSTDGGNILENGNDSVFIDWQNAGTYYLQVTETTNFGCIGDTIIDSITIYPLPTTILDSGLFTVCTQNLDSNTYSVTGFQNSVYNWTIVGGEIVGDSTEENVVVYWDTLSLDKSIQVIETTEYGCSDTVLFKSVYYDPSYATFSYVSDGYDIEENVEMSWSFYTLDTLIEWLYLYRGVEGEFTLVDSFNITETTYTDLAKATDSEIYQYYVSATNQCGYELVTPVHRTILLEHQLEENEDAITLDWNTYTGWGEEGLYEYQIWRSIDGGDMEQYDQTIDSTVTYTNTEDGFNHCYRIAAIYENDQDIISWSNTICVDFEHKVHVYNALTPNGDNSNETFYIEKIKLYPESQLEIYNRWGNLVYEKQGYINDWDGGNLSDGTYYYVLNLNDEGNTLLKGTLTLQR